MSEKFRAQMAKAEAERQAIEAKNKSDAEARSKQFKKGTTASATLDSYDSTIRTGGRESNLTYSETSSFSWGPWLLRKILLGFNGFFLVMGFIIMVLGGVASEASFSSVAGKSWTVGIAIIGMLIFVLGAIGALGAYTKNRLILLIYMIFLVCMLLVVFIIGIFIAATAPSTLMRDGWNHASNDSKTTLQDYYTCCGLDTTTDAPGTPCPLVWQFNDTTTMDVCPRGATQPQYPNCFYQVYTTTPCMPLFTNAFQSNFSAIGALGIVIAIVMAVCMLMSWLFRRMLVAAAPRFKLEGG